jgi:hypothetical protein
MDGIVIRPKMVTIITLIFIIASIMVILTAIRSVWLHFQLGGFPTVELFNSTLNLTSKSSSLFLVIAILKILGACISIYTAIQFFRLQKWTRKTLAWIAWGYLIYLIGFDIFTYGSAINLGSRVGTSVYGKSSAVFIITGLIMGIGSILLDFIPIFIVTKMLKSRTVKSAFGEPL